MLRSTSSRWIVMFDRPTNLLRRQVKCFGDLAVAPAFVAQRLGSLNGRQRSALRPAAPMAPQQRLEDLLELLYCQLAAEFLFEVVEVLVHQLLNHRMHD